MVLVWYWYSIGMVPVRYWDCTGMVLVWRLDFLVFVSVRQRNGIGMVAALCWRSNCIGMVLVLSLYGVLCFRYDIGIVYYLSSIGIVFS